MSSFFPDLDPAEQGLVPLPPEAMRIVEVRAEPFEDGQRIRVFIETTPFHFKKRPHLEITLRNAQAEEISSATIIEPMNRKMELTMHLRGAQKTGTFSLAARLFYPELEHSDQREIIFSI